jgi:hypothetical protein
MALAFTRCRALGASARRFSQAAMATDEIYELQRLYSPAAVFAAHGAALRAGLYDYAVKTRNCPAKVDVQALWTRAAGERTAVAVSPSAGGPIAEPHPSAAGPLENVATLLARYHDPLHLRGATAVAAKNARVAACFAKPPLSELTRVERVFMVRVPSVVPLPSVAIASGKVYEVRAYTLARFTSLTNATLASDADAVAYQRWLARAFAPRFAALGGRCAGFWLRATEPAVLTSAAAMRGDGGGAEGGAPALNAADPVPDVVWVAEWDSRAQAEAFYAAVESSAGFFAGNPFAEPSNRYERVEVTWSDAHGTSSLIHSGKPGLAFETRSFHTPHA